MHHPTPTIAGVHLSSVWHAALGQSRTLRLLANAYLEWDSGANWQKALNAVGVWFMGEEGAEESGREGGSMGGREHGREGAWEGVSIGESEHGRE